MGGPFPKTLETRVNAALAAMRTAPNHHLPHHHRSTIYATLRTHAKEHGPQVLGWLAVLAARRVLPIFQAVFPADTLPRELLATAEGVLRGQVEDKKAAEMQDKGYHAAGSGWGYDEDAISWPEDLAAKAAYHALKEARGQEPLQHLEQTFVVGTVDTVSGEWVEKVAKPLSDEHFTDEQLCQSDDSDTAAVAAVAFSCAAEAPRCAPEKLDIFWTWWLKDAIFRAWEMGND